MHVQRLLPFTGWALALLMPLILGASSPALAQPTVSLRGNVGASFFQSPDPIQRLLHSGSNLGAEAGVRVGHGIAVTVGGGYNSFSLNEENARLYLPSGENSGDLSFLGGSIGVRYTHENDSDAHPYGAIGVGLHQIRLKNQKTYDPQRGDLVRAEDRSDTSLEESIHIAIGSLFRLNETYSVFAEPRYEFFDLSRGPNDAVRYFTLRLGIDVQF